MACKLQERIGTKQTVLSSDESDKSKLAHEIGKFDYDWIFKEAHSWLNSILEDLDLIVLNLHSIPLHFKVS